MAPLGHAGLHHRMTMASRSEVSSQMPEGTVTGMCRRLPSPSTVLGSSDGQHRSLLCSPLMGFWSQVGLSKVRSPPVPGLPSTCPPTAGDSGSHWGRSTLAAAPESGACAFSRLWAWLGDASPRSVLEVAPTRPQPGGGRPPTPQRSHRAAGPKQRPLMLPWP